MDEVIYDRSFFDQQVEGSLSSARIVLPILFEYYKPTSVIDIGCGRGAWLRAAAESGAQELLGIDGHYVDRDTLLIDAQNFQSRDLKERIDLPRRFDLAISVEVAEHLPFHRSETFVADLAKLSDVILFSAALPYQGGIDHINEQWLEFWAILFRRHGYVACDLFRRRIWDNNQVEFWYTQNIVVFCLETLARGLFPLESIATSRPLSFAHPLTFLVNVTRHRPLSSYALDLELQDYLAILAAYLSGGTTLPLMKVLDATGTQDGLNVPLFPHARTQMMNVDEELVTRQKATQRQAADLEARDKEIGVLNDRLEREEADTKRLTREVKDFEHKIETMSIELSSQRGEVLRKETELQTRDLTITSLLEALAERRLQVTNVTQDLDRRDIQVANLTERLAEREGRVAGLTQTLAEREAQVTSLSEMSAERETRVARLSQTLAEREAQVATLSEMSAERETRVARLSQTLAEREAQAASLTEIVAQRETHAARLSQTLAEREAQVASLSERLAERENVASALLQSRSWRVTRPLRFIWALFRLRLFRLSKDWWVIRNSGLFDSAWYVGRYPDAASFRWGPFAHYLIIGAAQGRDPHQLFDASYYIQNNPDVGKAGINPLSHYLRRGAAEGRDPSPVFDRDWYLAQYPEVAKRRTNPLLHYLQHGRAEGRVTSPPVDETPQLICPTEGVIHPQISRQMVTGSTRRFATEIDGLRHDLAAQVAGLTARVTVVIPCYNYGQYVLDAVNSVLAQIYPRVYAIIVNDGSTDPNTLSVLAGIQNSRVMIHHQENKGLSIARNNGAFLADSEYLMFLDADDRLAPEAVALLLLELNAHPDRAYAYSYQRFFGDKELVWACQPYNAYDLLWRNHPTVCSLIHRDWFRKSPGYRPQMLYSQEDWEYWVELSNAGGFGFCVPVPVFEHRRHGVTMTQTAETHLHYSAPILRHLNKPAYSPAAIVERKRHWRPTVSVVIPFYNRTEYVSETLTSLAEQTIADFEVILVNDGSDDPEALSFLTTLRSDGLVRVLDYAHKGVAAARNAGVAAARSEYIFFLDSDDLLEPTALEKLSLMAALHPNVAFFYTGVIHFGSVDGVCAERFDREKLLRENFLTVSCLIRRDIYLEIGGQDETLVDNYEDYDFWLRLIEGDRGGMLLPEPLLRYRRHRNSRTQANTSNASHEELLGRLRERHPALYGGAPVDRSKWKLMKRAPQVYLKITEAFAALYRSAGNVEYQHWRMSNTPAPFQPRYWNDQRLHVLYFIPFCAVGGAERVDLDILSGLPKSGFHVTLVTAEENGNAWLSRFVEMVDEVFFLPSFAASEAQIAAILPYLCFSRNIDLVFNRNTFCGYAFGDAIKRISSTVAVADLLHLHDNGQDWVRASAIYHNQLDARFVISNDLRRHATSTYALPAEDFIVVPNGVDTRRELTEAQAEAASAAVRRELGIAQDSPVIAFVGRITAQKDPIRWVETAALIAPDAPTAHFLMVGDGDLRPQVERAIDRLDLNGRVHLTGYRDDIDGIFAATTLLLLTSRFEGLPMVILEAMLQGVPVVSTRTGGTDECVTDAVGALVPVDAPSKYIAERVIFMLNRIREDPSMTMRCKERVQEHFSLDRMQSDYRNHFERLCAKRDTGRRLEDYETWFMMNTLPW